MADHPRHTSPRPKGTEPFGGVPERSTRVKAPGRGVDIPETLGYTARLWRPLGAAHLPVGLFPASALPAQVRMPPQRRKARARPPLPKPPAASKAQPPPLPRYLEDSRHFATGFLFILPLLMGYEVGLVLLHAQVVNWAHGLVRLAVLRVFGPAEPMLFAAVVALLLGLSLRRTEGLRVDLELFGVMFIESVLYAGTLGLVCSVTARRLLLMSASGGGPAFLRDIVLSVGAGVYEEILFRVVVLGGLYYALKRGLRLRPALAAAAGIIASSLLFAACHHLGPYGEPLEMARVSYRFAMGSVFAALYIYRGLGIVVYTHALYDVIVSLSL